MKNSCTYLRIIPLMILSLFLNRLTVKADDEGNKGKITGVVKTSDDKPAPLVTVTIKELNKSTNTSDDGSFIFYSVKPGTYTLIASCVGCNPKSKP